MPDNLEGQVDSNAPAEGTLVIPKLCIYARLQFDPNEDLGTIKTVLIFPTGETRDVDMFDADTVARARQMGSENGAPIAGVFSRMMIPNFPILAEGRLQVHVTIKDTTYVAGAIRLKTIRSSATEPPPLSSQSPPAGQASMS